MFLYVHVVDVVKVLLYVHRNRRFIRNGCFTSKETVGLLGTRTRVVVKVLLYVHRNRRFIRDGSPGCCRSVALRPKKP